MGGSVEVVVVLVLLDKQKLELREPILLWELTINGFVVQLDTQQRIQEITQLQNLLQKVSFLNPVVLILDRYHQQLLLMI